jgi:hypothetical protein
VSSQKRRALLLVGRGVYLLASYAPPRGVGMADGPHRVTGHYGESIFMLEEIFGTTIAISTARVVAVRFIGE